MSVSIHIGLQQLFQYNPFLEISCRWQSSSLDYKCIEAPFNTTLSSENFVWSFISTLLVYNSCFDRDNHLLTFRHNVFVIARALLPISDNC
jgi:hypothetical protein